MLKDRAYRTLQPYCSWNSESRSEKSWLGGCGRFFCDQVALIPAQCLLALPALAILLPSGNIRLRRRLRIFEHKHRRNCCRDSRF
ncbi:hypothetical protein VTO42DRAFT_5320 [Malbranchea cinnamomea]